MHFHRTASRFKASRNYRAQSGRFSPVNVETTLGPAPQKSVAASQSDFANFCIALGLTSIVYLPKSYDICSHLSERPR